MPGEPIRALIVDDEPLARRIVAGLLSRHQDIVLLGECGSGREALAAIRAEAPDLLFLDIQMPECDGFDVVELAGADLPSAIVFVTAHDRHALRAFEVGALDYLLKPYDDARFERMLARARERLAARRGPSGGAGRLMVKQGGTILFLRHDEIDWIEAADYYAALHVAGRTHLIRRSLADLERTLDPNRFRRVHRSAIVNLDRIAALEPNTEGDLELVLRDGTRVMVSRRRWPRT